MIVTIESIQFLKDTPNSAYQSIKTEFLYHSNKLEGSTFTRENLEAQKHQDFDELKNIFTICQQRLEEKFEFLKETLAYMQEHPLEMDQNQTM